jgi:hypothetical protein
MNSPKRSTGTASHLTVRGVPAPLARAIEAERRRRGTSLNQTVLDLLARALGVGARRANSNGLRGLAGTWSAKEHARFEDSIAFTEQVDEELWR